MSYIPDDMMRDVVMYTRASLQRNFADLPFPACLDETGAQNVIERVGMIVGEGWSFNDLTSVDGDAAAFIRMYSGVPDEDLAASPLPRGLFIRGGQPDSDTVSVNGREHIRFTVTDEGWQPEEVFLRICALDDALNEKYEAAFDEKLGYLTAAPGDVGTAFRMSSELFLPALESDGRLGKIMPQLGRLGLSMRQTYGAGMAVYTLSTQTTMGQTEQESLKKLSDITTQLCGLERAARSGLLSDDPDIIADRSARAAALLSSALIIPHEEYKRLWKDLRSAVFYGHSELDYSDIDRAAGLCENDILGVCACGLTDDRGRDKARAEKIQEAVFAPKGVGGRHE